MIIFTIVNLYSILYKLRLNMKLVKFREVQNQNIDQNPIWVHIFNSLHICEKIFGLELVKFTMNLNIEWLDNGQMGF